MPDPYSPATSLDGAYLDLDLRLNERAEFDRFYVPRPARRVDDLAFELARGEEVAIKRLFAGHGGSGKSTELFRLLHKPEVTGAFTTVYYSVMADYGIPDVQLVDVLLTMALEIIKQVEPEVGEERLVRRWLSDLHSKAEETTARQLAFSFSKVFGIEVARRTEVRKDLAPRLQQVIEVLDALTLKVRQETRKRLLVIVDDLEKTGLDSALRVFCENPYQVAAPACDTIFTVPLSLVCSPHCSSAVRSQLGDPVVLPMIPVEDESGSDDEQGIGLLLAILHRRAAPELFEDGADRMLTRYSGGVVMDLLHTTRQAILTALRLGQPRVTKDIAAEAMRDLSRTYWRMIEAKYYDKLIRVAVERRSEPDEQHLQLLHSLAVLEYDNDPAWYDVHPAVRHVLAAQGRIAKDDEGRWYDTRETNP